MITAPKVLLLCSGRLAVPMLHQLTSEGLLAAIAVSDTDPKAVQLLQQQTVSLRCPFHTLDKEDLSASLARLCEAYQPTAVFVIGFPWRIPEALLSVPPRGFLNFHGGLLPELRGPDPIFEAIRRELPETALSVHLMDAGWDTGPVVCEDRFALPSHLTHGLLSTQLAYRCAQSLPALLDYLQQRIPYARPQTDISVRYFPRVTTAELYIKWATQPANAVAALIRACNPVYGGAATMANGWTFRIVEAAVPPNATHTAAAGTLLALDETQGALIQCCDGALLQARVIGTDEGYFPASRLHEFGLVPGICFHAPAAV